MNRRKFIKSGAIWVPAIVGLQSKAQVLSLADPAKVISGPVSASCSTARDSLPGPSSEQDRSSGAGEQYLGGRLTAGASYTNCTIKFYGYKSGTLTKFIKVGIYSHNSGANEPNALLGSWSESIAHADLPSSSGEVTVSTGLGASISSGTVYWIIFAWTGAGTADSTNSIWVNKYNNGASTNTKVSATATGPWSTNDTNRVHMLTLYSA